MDNRGSGGHGTRKRECECGRLITVGGPWAQHTVRCRPYQDARATRLVDRALGLADDTQRGD